MSKEINVVPELEYSWKKHLEGKWDLVTHLRPDFLNNPEITALRGWINDRMNTLPQMDVSVTDLTDGQVWQAVSTPESENVLKIERTDGTFFALEGRKVKKTFDSGKSFEWSQPVIITKEQPISIPTLEGRKTLPIHGFLGVIPDTNGSILMRIDQELLSENEKQASAMLAIQASVSKIALVLEGHVNADRSLTGMLEKLAGGNIENLLANPNNVVPIVSEDPNREFKHNLLLSFDPIEAGSALHEELTAHGENRWCSRAEIDALALARLTNGHTLSAVRTWEALKPR